jgi:hypothetical protein
VNRVATLGLPVAYGLSGLVLLALSLVTGAAGALAAAVLLATLLLAQVADPPLSGASPRRRALGRIVAAVIALTLATVAMITAIAAGLDLVPQWQWVAVGSGVCALLLLTPLLALGRVTLEVPILRSERTALTRGAAICATLGAAMLIAGYVLPATAALIAVVFALFAVLEGVAMARPGGAGLRRLPSEQELAAVDAAVATGPPEVIGHRRVVVRSAGGAEYLSLEVLIRQYELARVDEAKEGPLIQQVDVAVAPERRSKPKRAQMVLVAAFAGLFLGVLVAFVRRALRKAQSDPASAGQWLALKKAWSLRG